MNSRALVEKTPLVTTVLLESANVGQIGRMWREHSALGQSLGAWLLVSAALLLWANFYRVMGLRLAMQMTLVGVGINLMVVSTVIYFRFLAGGAS